MYGCVISAQGQGLLCEVPRSAKDDNVKYIGYCSYHYKKMVRVTVLCQFILSALLVGCQRGYLPCRNIPSSVSKGFSETTGNWQLKSCTYVQDFIIYHLFYTA